MKDGVYVLDLGAIAIVTLNLFVDRAILHYFAVWVYVEIMGTVVSALDYTT